MAVWCIQTALPPAVWRELTVAERDEFYRVARAANGGK